MMRHHFQTMAKTTYQVFVERDGNFGVMLSQMGAMVRTATASPPRRLHKIGSRGTPNWRTPTIRSGSAIPHILRRIECAPKTTVESCQ